ncbi:MAG: hypothetical protein V3W18_00040 [candidate division Zixibacteria bacterium]
MAGYPGNVLENKATAIALFGTLWFEELMEDNDMFKTMNFFFRYSILDPDNDDVNSEVKSTEMILGVECALQRTQNVSEL